MPTQEMKYLPEMMEPLSNNVLINIPGPIRFTNNLMNLIHIKLNFYQPTWQKVQHSGNKKYFLSQNLLPTFTDLIIK